MCITYFSLFLLSTPKALYNGQLKSRVATQTLWSENPELPPGNRTRDPGTQDRDASHYATEKPHHLLHT